MVPDGFLDLDDAALLAQCSVDVYRASGPGGQKRNKIESAVRLRHAPTGILAVAEESRSQHENKARALKRLRRKIALHLRRTVTPEGYRPSPLLAGCISGAGKLHVGRRDARFNAAVQELLDVLCACGMQVSTGAKLIGVTTANLTSFLRDEPDVWRRVNEMRTAAGLKGLK
ncbi:MAG TPA: peptide chain release factor-like protein [Phycisphaerae bacterium]|nr:peptide chain release factor-like protein [Phycisphaerae bacterium]